MLSSGAGAQPVKSTHHTSLPSTLTGTGFSPVFSGSAAGNGGIIAAPESIASGDSYTFTEPRIPSLWAWPGPMAVFECATAISQNFLIVCRLACVFLFNELTNPEGWNDRRSAANVEQLGRRDSPPDPYLALARECKAQ